MPTVLKKHWKLYAFLVPVFIPLIIFGYLPAVDAFKLAFTDNQSGAFVGLQNFIDMASDRKLIKSVGVMLKLLVAGLITGNIPAPVSYTHLHRIVMHIIIVRGWCVKVLAMEAVREIMRIKDVRPAELYNKLGIASNAYSSRMQQKNVSTAVLNEMVKPLGYKLVLVPDWTTVPEDSFTLD